MRITFDFLVSGFTIGCSVTRENFSFTALDALPSQSSLPSGQSIIGSILSIIVSYILVRVWRAARWNGVSYSVPVPDQAQHGWDGELITKTSIKHDGDHKIQCYAPATGKFLGTVEPATPESIDEAIKGATVAQEQWAKTSWDERKKVLRTLQKYILENQDHIVNVSCLDSGKTKIDAALGEVLVTVEKLKWVCREGVKALQPEQRNPSWPLMCYKKVEVRYEPLGVVAACVSWNYPFHNLLGPIISSIFAGNGIIVKGSEQTAWSTQYYIDIVKGALVACGHNPNLAQSVVCWPDVAPHLTSHPDIAHITFIGSKPVAHHVAASAAKQLTPLCVELGGKDAAIILDDTPNLPSLVSVLMRGSFQSCGQNCVGIERIVTLPKVYPQIVSMLEARVGQLRCGSALDDCDTGVDCGATISDLHFDRLEALVADAVKRGARLLHGGSRYTHPKHPAGHYFTPTLLVDVTPDMDIAQNEVFGPICVVMPATDVSDAIRIANSTLYGLGGSVFGRNSANLARVTREMKCGMVSINDFAVYYLNQSLPFGGVRGSGYGRFAGEEGLRSVCNLKAVAVDRFPRLVSTSIPPVLDYPIKDGEKAFRFTKGMVGLGYGEDVKRKTGGLVGLMGNL